MLYEHMLNVTFVLYEHQNTDTIDTVCDTIYVYFSSHFIKLTFCCTQLIMIIKL